MKVPDSVIKVKDLDLVEFMDNVQTILNQGLYETRIFPVVPTWAANEGESAIYAQGTTRELYFMIGAVWTRLSFTPVGTLQLFDADGDTGITPEATPDEDIIRFYTQGFYNFAMGTFGFAVAPGLPIYFDGFPGDTSWVYDTATNYLTAYVDGAKRQEM